MKEMKPENEENSVDFSRDGLGHENCITPDVTLNNSKSINSVIDEDKHSITITENDNQMSGNISQVQQDNGLCNNDANETKEEEEDLGIINEILRKRILSAKLNKNKYHVCVACNEIFFFESGLIEHRKRRIVRILYNCSKCDGKEMLEFFNRCSLNFHLIECHKISEPKEDDFDNILQFDLLDESEFDYEYYNRICELDELNLNISDQDQPDQVKNNSNEFSDNNLKIKNAATTTTTIKKRLKRKNIHLHQKCPTLPKRTKKESEKSEKTKIENGTEIHKNIKNEKNCIESEILNVNEEKEDKSEIIQIQEDSKNEKSQINEMQVVEEDAQPQTHNQTEKNLINDNESEFWCSGCDKDFESQLNFVIHLKNSSESDGNNSRLYKCDVDGIYFNSECCYRLHKKSIHDKKPPFVCLECFSDDFTLDKWTEFYSHLKLNCHHFSKFPFYICTEKKCPLLKNLEATFCSFDKEEMLTHLEMHSKKMLNCNLCSQVFSPKLATFRSLIVNHLKEAHNKHLTQEEAEENYSPSLICDVCKNIFDSDENYEEHLEKNIETHSKIEIRYKCRCLQSFKALKDLTSHLNKSKNCILVQEIEDKNENKTFQEKQLKSNKFRQRPKPERIQPNRTINNNQSKSSCNSNTNSSKKCKYCSSLLPLKSLKRHENQCESNLSTSSQSSYKGNCRFCRKHFRSRFLVFQHGEEHVIEGHNICLLCNNASIPDTDTEDLKTHLNSEHFTKEINSSYPKSCQLCKKDLSNLSHLKEHYIDHHNLDKKHNCLECGQIFISVQKLLFHQSQSHTNEDQVFSNKDFNCTQCSDKKFKTLPGLRRHLLRAHNIKPKRDVDLRRISNNNNNNNSDNESSSSSKNNNANAKIPKLELELIQLNENNDNDDSKISKKSSFFEDNLNHLLNGAIIIKKEKGVSSKARLENGTFICLKCEEIEPFKNEDEFFDHVKKMHIAQEFDFNNTNSDENDDGTSIFSLYKNLQTQQEFWCPECGYESVVKPSLIKHLQYSHDDCFKGEFQDYIDKIGYGKKEEKPLLKYQCQVCRLKCENDLAYQLHIRTHGMAFLRLRLKRESNEFHT